MSGLSLLWLAVLTATTAPAPRWTTLGKGLEYAAIPARSGTSDRGLLEVVRVDAQAAHLQLYASKAQHTPNLTAAAWADRIRDQTEDAPPAVVVINAGMFARDQQTHVGMMACGKETHGTAWHKRYASVLVFDPKEPEEDARPTATVLDLDAPGAKAEVARYKNVVQNLRLIRGRGEGVWSDSSRRWSEAAIGEDRQGRLLLMFTREGHSMPAFNARILRELGVVRAQHLEGGPEASLSIRSRALNVDRAGTFETNFFQGDNRAQWALPNVLAVIAG
ncbi:MAG: phosphodiester glycosidase family protein [Myxococcota bacterium]